MFGFTTYFIVCFSKPRKVALKLMKEFGILNILRYFFLTLVPRAFNSATGFVSHTLPHIIANSVELTSTKRSRILGVIIGTVLMTVVVVDHRAFTEQSFKGKWLLLAFCLLMPLVIGALVAFTLNIKSNIVNKVWHFALIPILPFITITMTECLNGIFIYNMTYLGFFANYILILLLYFFVFAVSGSLRASIIAVNTPLYGLALAHCYIMEFRGTPFIPMDFLSITTAKNVANTYTYRLTYNVVAASLIFIFLIVLGIRIKTPKIKLITKIITRTFMGSFFAVIMIIFYFTSIFADMGIKPDFWNQARGYRNYGFVFSFFCNTKYLYMSEPSGYDPDNVGDFVASVVDDDDDNEDTPVAAENSPNIICIMNESLSDLSVLGEFTTNQDYMPFMRSLTENTVKGNLLVPVIGAGTSNTEFEFLTGHTTAFLPSGSNAYMLYINNPIASLTSTLEGQGYSSLALHPYYASGWNRVSVYENMGFNKFLSLENLLDISIMEEFVQKGSDPNYLQELADRYYPGRNMFLRQYISDSYNYKMIIEDYENRDKSKPYYVFNVTMQNHGGYTQSCVNFNESVYLTSTTANYPKTNRYLSLVKASDAAFEELINYFSNVDEPTVICMFGDHQPSVETKFIAEALGVSDLSNLTIEQEQKRHTTPFIIWANFDIEEQYIERLSSNYLSSYVLKTAGVKLTDYNKYLLKLSEKIPVIDTVGYIDSEGIYYRWSDTSQYANILDEYEKIQYNNIFDSENKDTNIFYLEGYRGDENRDKAIESAAGRTGEEE